MYQLKNVLDKFYKEYNYKKRMFRDPIEFPHRYKDPRDIEVSGYIASSLAYGKVMLFKPVIDKLLTVMGSSPYEFLMDFDLKKHRNLLQGISYRFNKNEDIVCMIYILHKTLKRYTTLEKLFMEFYKPFDYNVRHALENFFAVMLRTDSTEVYGSNIKPEGLIQFFSSPKSGSACKRANLFLRWMVRDKDIDFGIWKGVSKKKLVIPLDTHISRISICLGFTTKRTRDWETAVEITEVLKKYDPEDPVKYDFALCHHGISGKCRGMKDPIICQKCSLNISLIDRPITRDLARPYNLIYPQ